MKKGVLLFSLASLFLLSSCKNNEIISTSTLTTTSDSIHSTTYVTNRGENTLHYKKIGAVCFVGYYQYAGKDIVEIPSEHDGRVVAGISRYVFSNIPIQTVIMPNTIVEIKEYAFNNCTSLENLIFKGTKEEFNSILKEENWNYNSLFTKVTCDDGEVEI